MRLAVYASSLCVIGACAVVAVRLGTGWSWAFFLCAVAIGALAALTPELIRKFAVSQLQLTPEQVTAMQPRLAARRLVVIPSGLAMGVGIGLIAGSLEAPWIDVAYFVAMLLLTVPPALIALVVVKRRRPTAPNTL
jgi:hypothetical protein